uniref:Uncharacterized protein n=1 Tax=Chromera velia CCMP2878 TaxID=1169474 RepID=A0A0G4G286_9ALVE|mmetsp:Transcript_49396/g.97321  ORF Transcript_49396/g.97321 Transcript_49396/m.97321 type:complete len:355 (+) Transcript_49396:93-1157(+)|eukprot:Cvel_4085.t1-p1 / transcript=Cvel_4085.t1 / gene=Cvel_4085 / organism=Chromera_velia_CCMP2878 / gene_product=hypothetical protein / transcript_product=hypothetical protein / location=Cvel_scaffold174:21977-23038(+) / protein_length=354 / sequence_SO=supercontig / SO=protein_coding / is_pseudo=false
MIRIRLLGFLAVNRSAFLLSQPSFDPIASHKNWFAAMKATGVKRTVSGPSRESEEKGFWSLLDRDPFDLKDRFVETHKIHFPKALKEILAGAKRSHWSWYIFPVEPFVVNGVERGSMQNQRYCLRDPRPNHKQGTEAAKAFLRYEDPDVNLRGNYLKIMQAVLEQMKKKVSLVRLLGPQDDSKFISSVRLFERASRHGFDPEVNALCLKVLEMAGKEPDPATAPPRVDRTQSKETPAETEKGKESVTAERKEEAGKEGKKEEGASEKGQETKEIEERVSKESAPEKETPVSPSASPSSRTNEPSSPLAGGEDTGGGGASSSSASSQTPTRVGGKSEVEQRSPGVESGGTGDSIV